MGKLIPFRHPGNYRLIDVDGQLYRFPIGQPIPKEASLLNENIMDMPGLWSHPRYNERAKKRLHQKKVSHPDSRGHDNP